MVEVAAGQRTVGRDRSPWSITGGCHLHTRYNYRRSVAHPLPPPPPLAHGRPPVSLDPPHPSFIPPQASTQRRPLRRIEGPKTLHGRHAPLSALGGWSMSHLCLFLRFIAFSSSVAFFIFNVGVSCVASVQFNARLVTFPFVLIVHKINQ